MSDESPAGDGRGGEGGTGAATGATGSGGPVARVEALARRLEGYQRRYERARDSRAVFAYAYRNLTLDLADRLAGSDHGFDDPAWVADLAVAFGDRYVAAMDAIDGWLDSGDGEPALYDRAPKPWADVYLAMAGPDSLVVEDLVFAMAAHISHDLPRALLDVDHGPGRLRDYHLMNDVLADRTDHVQTAVERRYSRFLGRLDRLAGGADEAFTGYGIRVARSVAWYNAMRLSHPASRPGARGSIDRAAAGLVAAVRDPGPVWLDATGRVVRLLARWRRWPEPPPPEAVRSDAAATGGDPEATDAAATGDDAGATEGDAVASEGDAVASEGDAEVPTGREFARW